MVNSQEQLLSEWFKNIITLVNSFNNESDVDDSLWPIYKVSPLTAQAQSHDQRPMRLLEILGYTDNDVDYQRKVPMGRGKGLQPDFVLKVNDEDILIIEDKAPTVQIKDYIVQLSDYFLKINAPLGLLFNIKEAFLIINSRLPDLKEYAGFESECVLQASFNNLQDMLKLLSYLTKPNSVTEMISIAIELAKQRDDENKREENRRRRSDNRQKRFIAIAERIAKIKTDPPDYLIKAIIASDENLRLMKNIKEDEIRDAWFGRIVMPPLLPDGELQIKGVHQGKEFSALLDPKTKLVTYANNPPCKASRAALQAIHSVDPTYKSVNGKTWWTYFDSNTQQWLSIKPIVD